MNHTAKAGQTFPWANFAGFAILGLFGPVIADGALWLLESLPQALCAAASWLAGSAGLLFELARWALGL